MRVLARIGSALAVLALAAPAAVFAQGPPPDPSSMPNFAPTPDASAAPRPHRHGLFSGRRHCVECQRADVLRKRGINVPPPPSMPGVETTVSGTCADCGKPVIAMKNKGAAGMSYVHAGDAAPAPPGMAMVGDLPPGMAPEAIGTFNPALVAAHDPNVLKSPRDEAIMTTSAASPPIDGHHHNRPHILIHALNLDGRSAEKAERAFKKKQAHASISYGPTNAQVTELPARLVNKVK